MGGGKRGKEKQWSLGLGAAAGAGAAGKHRFGFLLKKGPVAAESMAEQLCGSEYPCLLLLLQPSGRRQLLEARYLLPSYLPPFAPPALPKPLQSIPVLNPLCLMHVSDSFSSLDTDRPTVLCRHPRILIIQPFQSYNGYNHLFYLCACLFCTFPIEM